MKKQTIALALGALFFMEVTKADVDNTVNNSASKVFYTCSDDTGVAFKIEKKKTVSSKDSENYAEVNDSKQVIELKYDSLVALVKVIKQSQFLTQAQYEVTAFQNGALVQILNVIVSESVSFKNHVGPICGRGGCPQIVVKNIMAKLISKSPMSYEKIFSCHI